MSDDEFWDLTFRELIALQDRWSDHQKREDLRFGMLLAQQHNMNRGKNDKAVGPADFFPSLDSDATEVEDTRMEAKWNWWAVGINEQQQAKEGK